MLSFTDFIKRFGACLFDKEFQLFLFDAFVDLTTYNILESSYIISRNTGIELGFQNEDAVVDEDDEIIMDEGHPVFSHFNLYPESIVLISEYPFGLIFSDKRNDVLQKAGEPIQSKQGDFLGTPFLIDHYKLGAAVVSIDYNTNDLCVKSVQIRDNNLFEHLSL